jgi:hypothetical protein
MRQCAHDWRDRRVSVSVVHADFSFQDVTKDFKVLGSKFRRLASKLSKKSMPEDSPTSLPVESAYTTYQQEGLDCALVTAESIYFVHQCKEAEQLYSGVGRSTNQEPASLHDLYSQKLSQSSTTHRPSASSTSLEPKDPAKGKRLEEATHAAMVCAKTDLDELRSDYPEFESQVMCRLVGGPALLGPYVIKLMKEIDETVVDDSELGYHWEKDTKE